MIIVRRIRLHLTGTPRRFAGAAALVAALAAIPAITSLSPAGASAGAPARSGSAPRTSAPSFGAQQAALYPIQRTLPLSFQGSCTAVRRELPKLAREDLKSVGCTKPAAASSLPSRVRKALASSLCVTGYIIRTRHDACALGNINYEIIEVPSGEVLGSGVIVFGYYEDLNSSSWKWSLVAGLELVDAEGAVAEGTVVGMAIDCANCVASGTWVQPLTEDVAYFHAFPIAARGGAVTTTRQAPVLLIANPAGGETPPATFPNLGPARCDKIAVAGTQGCVFSDVAASYYVYLTGQKINDVAINIFNGERTKSDHFGWYGHGKPLTRATNSKVQSKNRQAACGKKRYKGLTCDEYPFAATYQGAYYYPNQTSTRGVPGDQNSREGAYRVNMYRSERLLNLDPYWVFVEP